MPFVFFALLGFPTLGGVGNYVSMLSSFSGLAFFIFCGFFTLVPNREQRIQKLGRAIKRSLILFAIMFVGYLALNIAYLAYIGGLELLLSSEFLRLRTIFDFLALNLWKVPLPNLLISGNMYTLSLNGIWFIQSLLYAYVFLFLAEKLKLSKIYVPLLCVLVVFMLGSGEFAKVFGFPYFGYSYIPGGFLTKALPFMLIGMLLRKFVDKLYNIPRFIFIITFVLGIGISVGEIFLLRALGMLVYTGNMIGYAVMALSVCCFAVGSPDTIDTFLGNHGGSYAKRMYALCQPVYLIMFVICLILKKVELLPTLREFASIISLVVCFIIAFFIGLVKFKIADRNAEE